jgi:hypothetical protein
MGALRMLLSPVDQYTPVASTPKLARAQVFFCPPDEIAVDVPPHLGNRHTLSASLVGWK